MKRRQLPIGKLFEDTPDTAQNQSILGDPLWIVNYALPQRQATPQPPQKPSPSPKATELIQPKDESYHSLFPQHDANDAIEPPQPLHHDDQPLPQHFAQPPAHPSPPQPRVDPVKADPKPQSEPAPQISKAQQLIQQSQALLQRRKQLQQPTQTSQQPAQQALPQHAVHETGQSIDPPPIRSGPNLSAQSLREPEVQDQPFQHFDDYQNPPQTTHSLKPQTEPTALSQVKTSQNIPADQYAQATYPRQRVTSSLQLAEPAQVPRKSQPKSGSQLMHYTLINGFQLYCNLETYLAQSQFLMQPIQSRQIKDYPGPSFVKGQKNADHARALRYFWNAYRTDSAILQLAIDNAEKNIFRDNRNGSIRQLEIQLLNDPLGQRFIAAYESVFNNSSWENKLFITLLQSYEVNIMQQETLIQYLNTRTYYDNNEALVMMLALILKMEHTDVKQAYYNDLYQSLSTDYSPKDITARLLWLALKLYPSYVNDKNLNFDNFFLSYFSNQLKYELATSAIQILLADTYAYMRGQSSPELYYKLALLFAEQQNFTKALDCTKQCSDFPRTRDLRDKLLQAIELSEKLKKQISQPLQQPSGFLNYFNTAVKSIAKPKETPKQQESQFYYDNDLKAWVINGVPQVEEEIKQDSSQATALPPPQPPTKQPPPPPVHRSKPQPMKSEVATGTSEPKAEPKPVQQQVSDPFAQPQAQEQNNDRQKKANLIRNRYVQ